MDQPFGVALQTPPPGISSQVILHPILTWPMQLLRHRLHSHLPLVFRAVLVHSPPAWPGLCSWCVSHCTQSWHKALIAHLTIQVGVSCPFISIDCCYTRILVMDNSIQNKYIYYSFFHRPLVLLVSPYSCTVLCDRRLCTMQKRSKETRMGICFLILYIFTKVEQDIWGVAAFKPWRVILLCCCFLLRVVGI